MRTSLRLRALLVLSLAALSLTGGRRLRADVDTNGWIIDWLVYGPLTQGFTDSPGEDNIRLDYLTDGVDTFEATTKPTEGDEVIPDFSPGQAASTGFHPILNGDVATWRAFNTVDPAGDGSVVNPIPDTADMNVFYAGGAEVGQAIVYAVVYIRNPTASAMNVNLELGSDDSIQVKLDDCEVFILNQGRGFGVLNEVQNRVPISISPGAHRLLVKVFNGGGGYGFRIRLADPASNPPAAAALNLSLDPATFPVPNISPVGVTLSHTASPDRALGLDKPVTVTITAVKTFAPLADATAVTVRENLITGTSVIAGSAVPPPTTQTPSLLTWNTTVGDLVANGIKFDFKFDAAQCSTGGTSGCVIGDFGVGAGGSCVSSIGGIACTVAVPLNAIFFGDLVGGGDGLGNKPDNICGIRLDTGVLLDCANLATDNRHTDDGQDPDLLNPQPVDEAQYVDSVFFMSTDTMAINSKGVEFTFEPGDLNLQGNPPVPSSWNHILSNITHDIDKGVGNIVCGGKGPFATGVGVHASAGVTFNLDALRKTYGADKIVSLSSLVGIDGCAGHIRTYIIYSNDTEILVDSTWFREFTAGQAEPYDELIPPDAKYVTFATGTAGDGDGCDHGVWAEARIFPDLPVAVIRSDVDKGPVALTVNFNGGSSTAPAGSTIQCYNWDFGDGQTGSDAQVAHTYQKRGKYTARLTVQTQKGLSASSTKEISATFACGNVAPYTSADIGGPTLPGCAHSDGSCVVAFAGGKDSNNQTADHFQYVYKPKSGDVSFTAQVKDLILDAKTAGRAGLMFRNGTGAEADAAFAYVHLASSLAGLKASFQSRTDTALKATTKSTVVLTLPNAWLRLERQGNVFIGSASPDGTTFTEVSRATLTAPTTPMLAGMAVTAADASDRGLSIESTFCNVSFSDESAVENCTNGIDDDNDGKIDCADSDCAGAPSCSGTPKFHRGDADGNGQMQLTDAVRILNVLFLGTGVLPCADAADADDNGQIQLTDAVRILNVLFLGVGAIPLPATPGNGPCDVDPTPDAGGADMGCEAYDRC